MVPLPAPLVPFVRRPQPAPYLALLLALGCGGGDGATTPGPVPTSLVASRGDGQLGEPNEALAIQPAVAVRTASGSPVAGVSVTFRVDSGGGTIDVSTATTDAGGAASPGTWRLGPVEGRQVLVASAATLPVVRFVATAVRAVRPLLDSTLRSGRLTISTGPLAGTVLEIPDDAFSTAERWTLEQRSSDEWPRGDVVAPVSATLRVRRGGEAERADAPLSLTLPVPSVPPTGTRYIVLLRDPVSGAINAIPTIPNAAGTVTALTTHVRGSQLEPSATAATFRYGGLALAATMSDADYVDVAVSAVPVSELGKDVDTGFRPGRDQLGYDPFPTAIDRTSADFGMLLTELVYFARRGRSGAPLWRRFTEAPGVPLSTRRGLRAAGYVASREGLEMEIMGMLNRFVQLLIRRELIDQVFHDALKANLLVTRLPQFVIGSTDQQNAVLFAAYATEGNRILLTHPSQSQPGALSVTFDNGRFGSLRSPESNTLLSDFGFIPAGSRARGKLADDILGILDDVWPKSTLAEFPVATLKARTGFVEGTDFYPVDTARLWVECADCTVGMASSLTSAKVEAFSAFAEQDDGTWSPIAAGTNEGIKWSIPGSYDRRIGLLILQVASPDSEAKWLDWKTIRVRRWVLTVPDGQTAVAGQPSPVSAALEGPAAPPHRFVFTVGSGANQRIVEDTALTVRIDVPGSGPQPVKVEMKRRSDGKVIAVGEGMLNGYAIPPTWRITSITVSAETAGPVPWGDGTGIKGSWDYWQAFANGIRDGVRQGGLMFLERDSTFGGSLKQRGLYLLDATALTPQAVAQRLNLRGPTTSLNPFSDGRVRGAWLVSALSTFRVADQPALDERWQSGGTLTAGSAAGRAWEFVRTVNREGTLYHYPSFVRSADVTFTGSTASGTLTFIARDTPSNTTPAYTETARYTLRVTFQAERLK